MKFFSLLLILFSLLMYSCGEDDGGQKPNGPGDQDSTQTEEVAINEQAAVAAESAGILGKWELTEKRIPTPITMSGTFFSFNSDGILTISSPDDPDLEDLEIPFTYQDSSLSFDNDYQLVFVSGDSMVLESETDGIREINILKRR